MTTDHHHRHRDHPDAGGHHPHAAPTTTYDPIPFSRLVSVELRKMFDTRSGFWLLACIGILATLATGAVILFGADDAAHLRHLRRRDRHPDDGHPAGDRDALDHQRVEPAHRADDVHLRAATRAG